MGIFPEGRLTRDGEMGKPNWNRYFPQVRLSVGDALGTGAVTPERLRARVLALRGDWR